MAGGAEQRAALLQRAVERLEAIRAEAGVSAPVQDLRARVRDVVLIASSSRGGSSVFSEYLRGSRRLLHLRGEFNPFLVVAGLTDARSDHLPAGAGTSAQLARVERELALDCGRPLDRLDSPADQRRFAADLASRLVFQWPHLEIPLADVEAAMERALSRLWTDLGWPRGTFVEPQAFHAVYLSELRRTHPALDPWYYDLSRTLIRRFCPDAPRPAGPPGALIIEEPPFITAGPWELADAEALASTPLIIKTPGNAYRMDWLRGLFPAARIRVVHLTRNAAAAVNGLYDGWRYPQGFFYLDGLERPLRIGAYSDAQPGWGRDWWNYDLPPGWEAWAESSLEQVCGFQWRSAHRWILDFLDRSPEISSLRIRFEDLIGPPPRCREVIDEIIDWLGVEPDPPLIGTTVGGMPPVMATDKPRSRRWFERADLIGPVMASPETREIMARLGYGDEPEGWV